MKLCSTIGLSQKCILSLRKSIEACTSHPQTELELSAQEKAAEPPDSA